MTLLFHLLVVIVLHHILNLCLLMSYIYVVLLHAKHECLPRRPQILNLLLLISNHFPLLFLLLHLNHTGLLKYSFSFK